MFQLYEESQTANSRLSEDLTKVREELVISKKKWEEALKVKRLHSTKIGEGCYQGYKKSPISEQLLFSYIYIRLLTSEV